MVRGLVVRSCAKITLARQNEHDMPPKRTKTSKNFRTLVEISSVRVNIIFLILRVGVQ